MEGTIFYLFISQKYINSKPYSLCSGNISKSFEDSNGFSVDYSITNISNIINIDKYLMKKHEKK